MDTPLNQSKLNQVLPGSTTARAFRTSRSTGVFHEIQVIHHVERVEVNIEKSSVRVAECVAHVSKC